MSKADRPAPKRITAKFEVRAVVRMTVMRGQYLLECKTKCPDLFLQYLIRTTWVLSLVYGVLIGTVQAERVQHGHVLNRCRVWLKFRSTTEIFHRSPYYGEWHISVWNSAMYKRPRIEIYKVAPVSIDASPSYSW